MKLAEALILRADCQKRIEQLRRRLTLNAKVQEDETPPEDPQMLLTDLDTTLSELTGLITRINRTNAQTSLGERGTISDAIAQRDTLRLKRSVYSSLVETASYKAPRYGRAEIKDFSTVDIAQMQRNMDQLAQQYRELDTQIQAANWNTELVA